MQNLLNIIFSTEIYDSEIDKLKATFLYVMLGVAFFITFFASFAVLNQENNNANIYVPLTLSILGLCYLLVRNRQLIVSSWILTIGITLIIFANNIGDDSLSLLSILINLVVLTMAGFLINTPGIIFVIIMSVFQVFIFATIENMQAIPFSLRLTIAVIYIAIGLIIYSYQEFAKRSRLEGADVESAERLKLAEMNMRITRQASTRESLDTALNTTLNLILDNYPEIYHAQIFLIDTDGIQARLVASTGAVGEILMGRSHTLAIGSLSVIGQATLSGEVVIAKSNDPNNVHRINDLLPETTLEMAFPLRVDETIIGALDLQSQVLEDLSANDRLTFQSLANSLSLSIDSIRQFEEAKARIDENQRLTEQTRNALREVERLNQRLIGRAWTNYARGLGDNLGLVTDFDADTTSPYTEWTDTLAEARNLGNFVQVENIIALPLRVRGQVVGAIEFELDENQTLNPEDFDLINEVSERFGLAAENTRLIEESQRTAQREALINQVASRFQAAQNVESTLAEAARSISESLEASKVRIRLGEPNTSPNGKDT